MLAHTIGINWSPNTPDKSMSSTPIHLFGQSEQVSLDKRTSSANRSWTERGLTWLESIKLVLARELYGLSSQNSLSRHKLYLQRKRKSVTYYNVLRSTTVKLKTKECKVYLPDAAAIFGVTWMNQGCQRLTFPFLFFVIKYIKVEMPYFFDTFSVCHPYVYSIENE